METDEKELNKTFIQLFPGGKYTQKTMFAEIFTI